MGVQDVHIGVGQKIRIKDHTEQTAVREVVDVGAQIGEGRGRRIREAVEDLDQAAPLGDEDPAIFRELDDRGFGQAAEDYRLLEAGR
jgi:hypothetical protein